jgi:hypothetical protein
MRFIVAIKDRAVLECTLKHIGADAAEETACVATAWDAEALVTARAARIASAGAA